MIISIENVKKYVEDLKGWNDEKIARKLQAIEQTIRKYTHNEFKDFECRTTADIIGGLFCVEALSPFSVGDTVQLSNSKNKGLYTVISASDSTFTVAETVTDEKCVLVTKIDYPADVVECALDMLEWEIKYKSKIGVKSETLSRHSITYEDSSTIYMGYPLSILGKLKLYKKARF